MPFPSAPGVILSPHLDDAVLSCWAGLRSAADVAVVDVFTGVPPAGTLGSFDPVFGVDDSHDLMLARRAEDRRALACAGREAVLLDFLDDQYRGGRDPGLAPAVRERVAPQLAGATWVAAPSGIGAHPDHVLVRDLAVELARARGLALLLYSELPYAIWAGWPSWVTGAAPRPYLVPDARWRPDLSSIPGVPFEQLTPVPEALTPDEQRRKLDAIACYESQFEALNAGPLERLRHPEVIGFELHWQVSFRA